MSFLILLRAVFSIFNQVECFVLCLKLGLTSLVLDSSLLRFWKSLSKWKALINVGLLS